MVKRNQQTSASATRAGGCPRFWTILLVIVAVALIARLVAGMQLHASYTPAAYPHTSTDMATYYDLASKMLQGDYPYEEGFYYQPFYYAVFLPLVLAVGGGSTVAVVIVQALLGAATVLLIGLTFGLLFGRWAGLVGAGLLALARMHIFYTPFMLIAVLQGFLMALILYLAVLAYRCDKLWLWLVLGLVCGVANATRGNIVLLMPLLGVALIWRRRRQWRPLALGVLVLGATFYLPQLPFALVNYQAYDRWTGPSSAAGAVLALGNTPEAPPGGRDPEAGAGPMEYPAASHEWSRQAKLEGAERVPVSRNMWRWFKREPLAYIELKWRMLLLFWHRSESPNNVAIRTQGQPVPSYVATAPLLDFVLIGSLGLAGLVLALLYRRHRMTVWLAGGTVVIYCLSIVLFYILARFRLPIVPLICGFAGYALVFLVSSYRLYKRDKQSRQLLTGLAVYLVSLGVVAGGFDLYRSGLEASVMRVARPDGIQVELQHEWLVKDHGPMSYGGWEMVPLHQVQTLTKTFALPGSVQPLASSAAPYLRLPVTASGGGTLLVSVAGQPPTEHPLERGLQWLRINSELPIDWEAVTLEFGYRGMGEVGLIFDRQRDYGRTEGGPSEWVVELRIPKQGVDDANDADKSDR